MDSESKSIFASTTFWGAAVSGLSAVAGIFGVEVAQAEQAAIVQGIAAIGVAVGTIAAIVGRVRASKRIG